MHEEDRRIDTVPMDLSSKEGLIKENHPVIREIRKIPEILFDEEERIHKKDCISLKELFQKNNMDYYHVDCLILRKIARNMVNIQKKLRQKGIYPGLYCLEDIYVDFNDSGLPLFLIHPEKFQLLQMEQDYEWYPEDERVFGDIALFDRDTQLIADNRLLYKILVSSTKGNVKVPPMQCSRDYSALFFGTLPLSWQDIFKNGQILSLEEWEMELEEAIAAEEAFEKEFNAREESQESGVSLSMEGTEKNKKFQEGMEDFENILYAMFVILRREKNHSFEMSRMIYQLQDALDMEGEHGHLQIQEGFLYGDGVIYQKKFRCYGKNYRVQIPQKIQEYSIVETLLLACEWMKEFSWRGLLSEPQHQYRMYLLTDGRIENNEMFQECLQRISFLKNKGVDIQLILGKEAACEGWGQLDRILSQ